MSTTEEKMKTGQSYGENENIKAKLLKYQRTQTDFKIRYKAGYFEEYFDNIIESYNLPVTSLFKIALIEKFVRDGKSFPEGFDPEAEIESLIEGGKRFLATNADRKRNGIGHEKEKKK